MRIERKETRQCESRDVEVCDQRDATAVGCDDETSQGKGKNRPGKVTGLVLRAHTKVVGHMPAKVAGYPLDCAHTVMRTVCNILPHVGQLQQQQTQT
jgi:hypothetical protein